MCMDAIDLVGMAPSYTITHIVVSFPPLRFLFSPQTSFSFLYLFYPNSRLRWPSLCANGFVNPFTLHVGENSMILMHKGLFSPIFAFNLA